MIKLGSINSFFLVIVQVSLPGSSIYWESTLKVLHCFLYAFFVLRHVYHGLTEHLSNVL